MQDVIGSWNVNSYTSDAESERLYNSSVNSYSVILSSDVTLTFSEDGTWTSAGEHTMEITDYIDINTTTHTGGIGSGTFTVNDGKLMVLDLNVKDRLLDITSMGFEVKILSLAINWN